MDEPINIVAFGGGTGMPNLLRGLHQEDVFITAAVVVSDDGGSSGELRHLYNIPAPGDIRNVIVALSQSDDESFLNLLQFRFNDDLLKGHCLGNLALAALTELHGSFEKAVDELCRLTRVKGRVIPASFEKVALVATHDDGSKSTGEVKISSSTKPISHVAIKPSPPPSPKELIQKIDQAHVVLLGPGSLFTSVIPHLLFPGIIDAIDRSQAKVIYVANIMTQPGETTGFNLKDHVDVLMQHGLPRLDTVVCHDGKVSEKLLKEYQSKQSQVVMPSDVDDVDVCVSHLIDDHAQKIRHDPEALARLLIKLMSDDRHDKQIFSAQVTVVNDSGLHTRPASQIVKLANQFKSKITFNLHGQSADARSIMDLILLTATHGSQLEVVVEGDDASQALSSLVQLIESGFKGQVFADGNS